MLDVCILAEWCWCVLLFAGKRLERTLILAGGVLAAGYMAYVATPWLTRTLIPATSPVFRWAMSEVASNPIPASAISAYIPPETTATGGNDVHWITTHILLTMMFVAVTLSVFTCFFMMALFRETLWDRPESPPTFATTWGGRAIAFAAAGYLTIITTVLLGNLSWLHDFQWLQSQAQYSMVLLWVGRFVAHVI